MQDTYKLTIKASDLNGEVGGNTGTGEITITIRDINDNIPTLEKESVGDTITITKAFIIMCDSVSNATAGCVLYLQYEGSVEENTINMEVMRIKAIDMDLIHTDNWLAVYKIISGNEGGYFSITTDSETNEGIIMIHKVKECILILMD